MRSEGKAHIEDGPCTDATIFMGQSASAPGMVVHLGVGMSRGCQDYEFLASGIKSGARSDAVNYNGLPKARD